MFIPPSHPYRLLADTPVRISDLPTSPPQDCPSDTKLKKELKKLNRELYQLQRKLYADHRYSVLLVFQSMDAAGKDSTIRHVMSGVNPAGCQVFSFKQPSSEELKHDFLWRSARCLPERGRIGVFNRSYYEEVLVVRVHPEYLQHQQLPEMPPLEELWQQRYESIRDHELHIARNGTVILKFWLNISPEEQKQRFLSRLDTPEKNWKFSSSDIKERAFWPQYMEAYEQAINATTAEHAPWYTIPADNKPWMRLQVAQIIANTLKNLPLRYPQADTRKFDEMRKLL